MEAMVEAILEGLRKGMTVREAWQVALFMPLLFFIGATIGYWPLPEFLSWGARLAMEAAACTILLVLVAVPLTFVFGFSMLFYWREASMFRRQAAYTFAGVCFLALWFAGYWGSQLIRHQAFVRASYQGDQLVAALTQFKTNTTAYPTQLDELVPKYLPAIPATGILAYPAFEYRKDFNDLVPTPGSYELRIDCPAGGINFDRFIYWPSRNYAARIQNNGVERIRDWSYIHE